MKIIKSLLWQCSCVSLLIFCLGISWQIAKSINYGYPLFYQLLDIDQHINKYAAQNRFNKRNFVATDKTQRLTLFAQISQAINNNGHGLTNIYYTVNKQRYRLLTKAEVIHLHDVATLVKRGKRLWWLNLIPLTLFVVIYQLKPKSLLSKAHRLILSVIWLAMLIAGFIVIGFRPIFAYLHTLVFPAENQWFFYYQDSLMSTSMKAPDLFAAIGWLLGISSIVLMLVLHSLLFSRQLKAS